MIEPAAFHASLERHGLSFYTGVPDSLLKDLCAYISDHVAPADHVISTSEGAAVALAAGYHLGTGGIPVVYLQNSGIGNAINPLLSLADPAVYAIPMLLIIGWRGEPGTQDEPQHITQGRVQLRLLEALEVPYAVIGGGTEHFDEMIGAAVAAMAANPRPHVLLVQRGTFASYATGKSADRGAELTRPAALEVLLGELDQNMLVVSTTGMTSREVFDYRERHGQGHDRDFLTVGSMGHASQIALGIAATRPERSVICLDGDGAVLMHMGSLAIIGTRKPSNLRHVVINNGAHDSVGGQPTAGRDVELTEIARACGYTRADIAESETEIVDGLARMCAGPGPSMLEIRVSSSAHTDAGRPTTAPLDNKAAFMGALGIER